MGLHLGETLLFGWERAPFREGKTSPWEGGGGGGGIPVFPHPSVSNTDPICRGHSWDVLVPCFHTFLGNSKSVVIFKCFSSDVNIIILSEIFF